MPMVQGELHPLIMGTRPIRFFGKCAPAFAGLAVLPKYEKDTSTDRALSAWLLSTGRQPHFWRWPALAFQRWHCFRVKRWCHFCRKRGLAWCLRWTRDFCLQWRRHFGPQQQRPSFWRRHRKRWRVCRQLRRQHGQPIDRWRDSERWWRCDGRLGSHFPGWNCWRIDRRFIGNRYWWHLGRIRRCCKRGRQQSGRPGRRRKR